ncbi:hypothetical protein [Paucilactobacillus sp. N302-9]
MTCGNCGSIIPTGSTICPNCGVQLDSYYNPGASSGASGGAIAIAALVMLFLPVAVYNPLTLKYLLYKKRLFNIREQGRRLAYLTSWVYTGLFVVLFMLSNETPSPFLTNQNTWENISLTVVGVLFLVLAWEIINRGIQEKKIVTTIGHFLGWGLFCIFAVFSTLLIIGMPGWNQY